MEEELSKHIYKMNPPCPHCHEEHMWWHRRIPLWAEQKIDQWFEENKHLSTFKRMFSPAPVFVLQHFKCSCCGKEFSYKMGIHIEDRTDWVDDDCIPMGVVPVG